MMKNRLEKTRAVPKWEVGDDDQFAAPIMFVFSEGKKLSKTPRISKSSEHRD